MALVPLASEDEMSNHSASSSEDSDDDCEPPNTWHLKHTKKQKQQSAMIEEVT